MELLQREMQEHTIIASYWKLGVVLMLSLAYALVVNCKHKKRLLVKHFPVPQIWWNKMKLWENFGGFNWHPSEKYAMNGFIWKEKEVYYKVGVHLGLYLLLTRTISHSSLWDQCGGLPHPLGRCCNAKTGVWAIHKIIFDNLRSIDSGYYF